MCTNYMVQYCLNDNDILSVEGRIAGMSLNIFKQISYSGDVQSCTRCNASIVIQDMYAKLRMSVKYRKLYNSGAVSSELAT